MAESARNTYATTSANAAAVAPNLVAVVNDGTADRQIIVLGDQTTAANIQTVKAASTAPVATDMGAVVSIHPTNLPASAAAVDALANPTISQMGAEVMLFNGSTWDRQRGMSVATTTGDTGAKTATGNGATQTNIGNKGIQIFIVLGAVSGTTPTCTFKMQGSVDGGTNWFDLPGAATASLTASVNVGIMVYPGLTAAAGTTTTASTAKADAVLPRTWRVVWTIGGTIPSYTITSITYNYLPN